MSSRPGQESPLQSTRQMLDELDALMERMLSLPVGERDEELPPLPRDVLKTPTVAASLTVIDETDLADEQKPDAPPSLFRSNEREDPPHPAPRPRIQAPPPIITTPSQPSYRAPEEEEETPLDRLFSTTVDSELPPPLVIQRPMHVVTSPAEPRASLGFLWLKPLVWANQSFDMCTHLLGPFGQILRSRGGRMLLGLVGVLCLGVAAAWYVKEHIAAP